MIRVEVLKRARLEAAHAAQLQMLDGMRSIIEGRADMSVEAKDAALQALDKVTVPDLPPKGPAVFLLIEPPADMSQLPPEARLHIHGVLLSQGAASRAGKLVTPEAYDSALQASAALCVACIRGKVTVYPDGREEIKLFQVKPVHEASEHVLPLAALDDHERVAVREAITAHLHRFRDLL